jgi:hypothetical protein
MNKALIIKKEWLDKIFDDEKIWEMRTTLTKIRGKIKLIESGSGLILGECEIINSFKPSDNELLANISKHKVEDISLLNKWCCAWVIKNPIRYNTPIAYKHPQGAVIWVNL